MSTTSTPNRTISAQPTPLKVSTSSPDGKNKGLRFYLQDSTSQSLSRTPLSAIFLVQFDVKSGYELKWSKVIDESVSLKGVEFKSLPSGLHEVEREVISFVQPKSEESFNDLLYGVSVFHQNLDSMREDNSRSNVRMFSLGILVDPSHSFLELTKLPKEISWKPINYTKGLEYIDYLNDLLDDWDTESSDYSIFEEFFNLHSKLNIDQLGKIPLTPTTPNLNTLSNKKHHSHHYLLKLPTFLETLGPLIFKIWRCALLRERILLFDAPNIELNCSFAYCLSILSILPQDVSSLLSDNGILNDGLKFLQPIYSVGVNDIDWLKKLSKKDLNGFIASSTDEILSYKKEIHDVSVRFNPLKHQFSENPEIILSESSVPGSKPMDSIRATQRDLKRFKILSKEFNLKPLHSDIVDENGDLKWWSEVTEPVSWRQIAWSGFYWWASAGEKSKVEFEQEYEGLSDVDSAQDEVQRSLIIVGYFHGMTKRIFTIVVDLLNNEPNSNSDEELCVEFSDIFEMGLDPYSNEDKEFIIKFIRLWFNRNVKIGSTISNLCCF